MGMSNVRIEKPRPLALGFSFQTPILAIASGLVALLEASERGLERAA